MKSRGEVLRGRSVSVQVGRLLLAFICLLWLTIPSVWADEISVNNRGDYGNISVMELTGNFDANLPDGTVNTAPREALAKEFYRTHQDDYDFLIFFTNFDYLMPGAEVAGFYSSVKNDVQGLGVELFDHSSQFGSDGHLQGTIDMRSLEVNGSSPLDHDYTNTLNTLEHEILHRWSAHTKFLDTDGNISEALLGPDKSHWNYLLDSDGSLQYGNDWRDNGDGTFTSVAIRQNYSPLDLYLMGMIDKSAVPPMLLIDSPALSGVYLPKLGDTISGTARTVTIDQIIAAMGERIPTANEAPKSFKAAFIFVTRPDTFSGKELTSLEAIRNGFLTRFSILTDGQGLVQVTPTLQPELAVNPGIDQPNLQPRTLPPSLEEGVAWLRNQQQESGRWADVDQTAVRDTTETLAALGLFGADPGLELGAAWLTDVVPDSTDYLARRLEALALAGAPVTAAVADLFVRQNPDGGWGTTRSYQSSSTDTSLALRALVRAGQQQNPAALRAAIYLAEHQNEDGGWGGSEAFSMVQPSAHSLVALNPYENYPQILASLESGKSFLLAKQNTDGGFGNSPSTIYDSSAALLALGEVGASAVSTREAVTYLENRQFPDGSWYDSPFQTATAVQALWRATLDPDLAVSVESISLIPEQISHLPTEQVVSVVVNNLGRTDVQQATVSLYEGAVDAEHLLQEQTAAFPGLGSTTLTFPLTLDVARTYSLIVVVDPSDQVAELDEANNRAGKTLTVEETHDFAFAAEGVTLSKTDLLQGEGVTITAQLFNYGTVAAYSVPVRFSLSDGSSSLVDIAVPVVDLPAGEQTTVELFWHASIPGDNLQVVAEIDHNNLYAELDETNNLASTSLRVAGSQLPNLAFASEPQFSNDPALQDKATEISVTLLNSGSVTAQNVVLSYYQGAPEAGGVLLGTFVVPEISAGERMPVSFTWSEIPVIGEQLIVVRADVDGTLAEVDENDNQTLSRLMVLSRPDLVLVPADVSISPSAPREGEAVHVTVNIYNNGQQDASDVAVTLDLDGNLTEATVPLVAAKSWAQLEAILGESLTSGVHNLRVDIDPDNTLRELSEENNHAELSFGVQDADLWVSEQYFSPNGDGVKDTTELYYRFATEQVVSVEIRNDADEVVRYLDGSQSAPVLDGKMSWDGRNDRGAVVADGPYRINVISVTGSALGSIEVTVDTNQSPLFAALETEFLLDESIVCDLPKYGQWDWLEEERRLLFAVSGVFPSNYETGIYLKDNSTGELKRLGSQEWTESNPLQSYTNFRYYLSPNKLQLALTFDKLDRQTQLESSELWLVDIRGTNLRKLRDYDYNRALYGVSWSSTGAHLLVQKKYDTVELINLSDQTGISFPYESYSSEWAPDGTHFARFSYTDPNLRIYSLDGSYKEVPAAGDYISWLNNRYLVAVGMDSSERDRYIWLIDTQGSDQPILITDDFSHSLILAPDGNHFAFVEGFSQYDGVKKVVVVDTLGNKSIIREVPYLYDNRNGDSIISNLLWSADGKQLAYLDRQAEPFDESTFLPKLMVYSVDAPEQMTSHVFACSIFNIDSCSAVDQQLGMLNIESLMYWSEDRRFMVLSGGEGYLLFDLVTGEKRNLPVNPINYSHFLDEILFAGPTCNGGGSAVSRLASLLNLTADLRAIRDSFAISLYGTAADLNFANYRLEYVDVNSPNTWLPIQPSVSKPVVDDILTLWVPPHPGSYFIRLTAEDRAGNRSFSRKRVNWNLSSALTNIYRSEDIFSPNGDGVKDSVSLYYSVASPIQFTVDVVNADGKIVRRFARSYSQPMDDAVVWDGRDDAGQVAPDGDYTLQLADYSFPVEVDATAPTALINLGPYADQLLGLGNLNNVSELSDVQIVEGVNDAFQATFESPEAWSASAQVLNQESILVRSIESNLPSTESVVVWDGRDDSGQPVADSRYTLQVAGLNGETFVFEIYVVAGQTGIDLSFDSAEVTLKGEAVDVNLTELWVERKGANGFNGWARYQDASCEDSRQAQSTADVQKQCLKQFNGVEVGDAFRFQDYRLVAKDRAGNVTTVVAPRLKPDFELYAWGEPDIFSPGIGLGLLRYLNGEIPLIKQGEQLIRRAIGFTTLDEPWVDVRMQYWVDGEWHDAVEVPQRERPVSLQHFNDAQDGSFSFLWDATPVLDGLPFKIRLKAINAAGEERLSNEYSTDNLFGIVSNCEGFSGIVNLFENLQELQHQVVPVAVLEEVRGQWFPEETLAKLLQTNNPSYQAFLDKIPEEAWVDYLSIHTPEEIPGNLYDRELDLKRYATDYPLSLPADVEVNDLLRLKGTGESGTTYFSRPVAYQLPKCNVQVTLKDITVAETCSVEATTYRDFSVKVSRETDHFVYQSLAIIALENGKETILQFWDTSEVGDPKDIQINLTQFPPGPLDLFARLTYLDLFDGQTKTVMAGESLKVPDFTQPAPVAELIAPVSGTSLSCQFWQNPDGSWKPMAVEASLEASQPLNKYEVCYLNGETHSWKSASVADRHSLPGLESYQGGLGVLDTGTLKADNASELRLLVRDNNGLVGFDEVTLQPEDPDVVAQLSSSTKMFSPNADNRKDDVVLYYHLTSDAPVSIQVSGGTISAELLSAQFQLAGDHSFVWNGTVPGAGVISDGGYEIKVSAVDSCGKESSRTVDVGIDTVPPGLEIIYPTPMSSFMVGKVVEVSAKSDEQPIEHYTLQAFVGDSSSGTATKTVAQGTAWPALNRLGAWQTSNDPGVWTLVLTAGDEAGNIGLAKAQVELLERPILLSGMSLVPDYLSPNSDGLQDLLKLNFELLESSQITYEVLDDKGTVVHAEQIPELSPGTQVWTWNGFGLSGASVADGQYRCRLTAALINDPGINQVEELTFFVDSTPPTLVVNVPGPDSYLSEVPMSLTGVVDDVNLLDYVVQIEKDNAILDSDVGKASQSNYMFALDPSLTEGEYRVRGYASDLAGNRTELDQNFTIDLTPPRVDLLTPAEGAGFGGDRSVMAISGKVVDDHLDYYELRFGVGEAPSSWTSLTTGSATITNEVNFDWPVGATAGLADGRYILSLLATDLAGLTGEANRLVLIDNTLPVAEISEPNVGALITAPFVVTGTAMDGNMSAAVLEFSPGLCSDSYLWVPLHVFSDVVTDGTLGELSFLPADGDYCLRLTVTDLAENHAVSTRQITIDTTPPEPPVLNGQIIEHRDVLLAWTTSGEPDLNGYRIYRDDVQLAQQQLPENGFTDLNLLEGEYSYQIVAYDMAGNSSTPSNVFIAAVDRTPPQVALSHPSDGARIGGLIDVIGTAFSPEDFGEYRLSYGYGVDPATMTLLLQSPASVIGSRLGQWDSWGLPDGLYTLSLEAEDLLGNLAVESVQMQIDNTPPQAPDLNVPSVLQSDVSLTWEPNLDSDNAGYLLFRNGRLVNASGVVIGSLTPYLLNELDYLDGNLPDGLYRYVLYAVDEAGNQSLPSQEREVEIDTRPPRAVIVEPVEGISFEKPISVIAESEDMDIASIQFQYRPVGSEIWQDLGAAIEAVPYASTLDPDLLSLSFGELELRAVATDRGGKTDPDPAVTRIEYRDMTPPAAPLGLTVSFDCDEVALNWSINTEDDLAGYNVYLKYDNGYLSRQNSQSLQAPNWIHTFGGGAYDFVVKAVDQNGNESLSSETVSTQLKTPVLVNTEELTIEPQLDVSGTEAYPNARVQLLSKGATVAESLSDNNGVFAFSGVSLARGENEFSVVAIDSEGNRSCISDPLLITKTILLPPPEGMKAGVTGLDVQLDWDPVVDTELNQYYLYRDGHRLDLPTQTIASAQMTAYSDSIYGSSYTADKAVDGSYGTGWYSGYQYGTNKWLEVVFDQPKWVNGFYVRWPSTFWQGVDFEFQVWDGTDWQAFFQKTGNTSLGYGYSGSAYLTDKVRLLITGFNNSSYYAGVTELQIYEKPVIDLPSYLDNVYRDGQYEYQISSVNTYGMEGPLSPIYSVAVGDVTPPEPPVNLTVTAPPQGKSLHLSWEAGSTDTDHFNVYRADKSGGPYEMIKATNWDILTLVDTDLTNGSQYFYVVTAFDQFNNESVNSLESSGTPLDLLPPEAPSLFYPTVPGLDKLVEQDSTVIRGMTEPGARVQLFQDGMPTAEISALSASEINMEEYDFYGENVLLSPDGDYLTYLDWDRYDGGLILYNIKSGDETLIKEGVESFSWTANGQQIVYVYEDQTWNDYLLTYQLETGVSSLMTTEPELTLRYPSTSADGNIVAYVNSGSDAVWVLDRLNGTSREIFSGSWPEITAVTPDGTKVAYYDDDYGVLFITDLASGETIEVDDYASSRHFEWSPDSRYLAYFSDRNSYEDNIYVFDSETTNVSQTTDIDISKNSLHWSPDGKTIVYRQDVAEYNESLWMVNLSGEQSVLLSGLDYVTTLQWQASGEVVYIDHDSNQVNYLLPPGTFTFDSVSLNPGENQFYANATDSLNRLSPMSDSISVIYDSSRLPDIAVAENEVFLLPSIPAPGEQVVANVLVHNNTGTDVKNVKVDFYLWDSQANLEFLESQAITQLDGESTATLSISFKAPDVSGRSSLLVVADPKNDINELIESNNFADRAFQVTTDGGVQMSIALNRDAIASQQDLEINLELLNNGQVVDGRLEMKILDQSGHLVELLSQAEARLTYGLEQFDFIWNASALFAGEYKVWGGLYDDKDQLLAEQLQPFTVLSDRSVTLSLTTDRTSYGANDPVLLEIDLQNTGVNDILSNLLLKTVIIDTSGQELFSDNQPVSQLLPGMSGRFSAVWNTVQHAPGDFNVVTELWLKNEVLQSDTVSFKIYPVSGVTGDLRVEPQAVVYGLDFKLPFSVTNNGNHAAAGQLRVELFDPETLGVVATAEQDMSVSIDGKLTGEFTLSSTGLKLQNYRARFFHISSGQVQLISEEPFKVVDGMAPELEVKSPLVDETYRQLVNLEVVTSDDISGVSSVSYRLDMGDWQQLPFADLAAGRYATTWHPALKDNGAHKIEFVVQDHAGNTRQSRPIDFELQMDVTPPVTQMETGLPYYKSLENIEYLAATSSFQLHATDDISGVALTEYRIDSGEWYVYGTSISLAGLVDGGHVIGYRSTDALGNVEIENVYNFVIDNAPPVISIVSPVVGEFYNSDVLTQVEISDLLPIQGETVLLRNGELVGSNTLISDEGEYHLAITAVDSLGNQVSETVEFTIDKTAPVIVTAGVTDAAYYNIDVTPRVVVSDPYLATSTLQINGSDFVSGTVIGAEGKYDLSATASDFAGNTVAENWSFVVDKTAPESRLEFTNSYYQTPDALFVSPRTQFSLLSADLGLVPSGVDHIEYMFTQQATWNSYVDSFDLQSLSEGNLVINYRASDLAGNLEKTHSLSVIVDQSAPETDISYRNAVFTDIDGTLFVSGITGFELAAGDNLSGVARTTYRIDGDAWTDFAPFTLAELSDGVHQIDYFSIDRVANEEPTRTLIVTTDNTPPVTSINLNGIHYTEAGNLYITTTTNISMSATDNLSGVSTIEYRIDGGAWSVYEPLALVGLVDGQHVIGYRSADNVGNIEGEQELTLAVDNTAPTTNIVLADPQYATAGTQFVTAMTGFTLVAADNFSGVKRIEYRLDNGAWIQYDPFSLAGLIDGEHIVGYRSIDNLGNQEVEQTFSVTVDNTPPVTEIVTGTPQFVTADGTIYVGGTTAITLTANDNLSGVVTTEYRVDGGSWTSYAAFTLSGLVDGAHSITYRSSDSLGNIEEERTLFVVVDNTAPVTAITAGAPQSRDIDGTLYVTGATEFILAATDNLSGVAISEYRIDGGVWNSYAAFPLNSLTDGAHNISYRSVDLLGNIEDERTLSLVVDNSAPVTEVLVGTPQFTDSNGSLFVTSATEFALVALDNLSGVATSEYRIDGGAWTAYAPFSLSGSLEGDVFIEFRSSDNLSNLEAAQSMIVVVDNTPPVSSINLNNQSYMNANQVLVTRETEISLSAVDTLAGVDETYYRFDEQIGWTQYSGSFMLLALDFGTHVIHFHSVDHVMNMEIEQSMEFALIGVESQTSIMNVPRVLVWLGEEEKEHRKDRDHDEHDGKDGHYDDHYDDHNIDSSRQDALDFLTEAFAGQDAYSQVVSSDEEYLRAFRSGVFNLTLILNEDLPFGGDFMPEFVEGIRRGMGLMYAPGKHDGDFKLEELLGVKYKGRESNKKNRLRLQLYDGPLSAESEVGLTGSILKTELAGGTLAALIPDRSQAEEINRMTLQLLAELHHGDMVKVSLLRRHNNGRDIVDEEWLTVEDDDLKGEVDQNVGNIYGGLSLSTHDNDELNIRLASKYGSFEGVYELDVVLISHVDGTTTSLIDGLTLDWGIHWTVGAPVGICRVVELNNKSKQRREDLPGAVLHQFGEGRTAFMAFDLVASAKVSDRSTYLSLLQNSLGHLLPEQSAPEASSTELLETSIKLSGSAMNLVAVEHLWPGLNYKPLFNHSQDLLEYNLSFQGEDEARYRYFVQSEDRLGTFGKNTEVHFYLDGIATTYGSYPYSFDIEFDSDRLLQDTVSWLDDMILLSLSGTGNEDHDDHDHHKKCDDNDEDIRFREIKEQLINISLMRKDDAKSLDKVIDKVLHALSRFDNLPVDSSMPRSWMNDYLRIMEVKYDLPGGTLKEKDSD